MICPADSPSPTPGKPVKLTLVANVDRRSPSGERPHPFVSSVSARASSLFGDGCMAGGGIYAFWHIGPVLDAGGGRSHSSVDCFCVVAAHLSRSDSLLMTLGSPLASPGIWPLRGAARGLRAGRTAPPLGGCKGAGSRRPASSVRRTAADTKDTRRLSKKFHSAKLISRHLARLQNHAFDRVKNAHS